MLEMYANHLKSGQDGRCHGLVWTNLPTHVDTGYLMCDVGVVPNCNAVKSQRDDERLLEVVEDPD